jgi:hypothetical protein
VPVKRKYVICIIIILTESAIHVVYILAATPVSLPFAFNLFKLIDINGHHNDGHLTFKSLISMIKEATGRSTGYTPRRANKGAKHSQ